MHIVLCGSTKYRSSFYHLLSMYQTEAFYKDNGSFYQLTMPSFIRPEDEDVFAKLPVDLQQKVFAGLTLSHFELIKRADIVCVGNWDGYIGNSTAMEMGYAKALGKKLIAFRPPDDESLRHMFNDYIHIEYIDRERALSYLDEVCKDILNYFKVVAKRK